MPPGLTFRRYERPLAESGCRAGTRTRRPPGPRNWAAVVMSAAARRPAPAVSQTACNPRCALWTAARVGPRVGPERVIWVAGRGPKLRGCPTGTWPISSGAGCSNWVPPRPRSPGAPVGSFRPRPSAAWRGQRSIRVGDRFARALAGALQVTEHRVRRAAGLPATEVPGEPTRPHLRLVRGGAGRSVTPPVTRPAVSVRTCVAASSSSSCRASRRRWSARAAVRRPVRGSWHAEPAP